jgi:hypothetical protein
MNKIIAIGFAIGAVGSWFWPGFNGLFFEPSAISAGEGRIIAAIFAVGAAILWFMPTGSKSDDNPG